MMALSLVQARSKRWQARFKCGQHLLMLTIDADNSDSKLLIPGTSSRG